MFGDGAAVSLIEESPSDLGFSSFALASHGKQYAKFYIQAGGLRLPRSADTGRETIDRAGNIRTPDCIQMDGMAVSVVHQFRGTRSKFARALPRASSSFGASTISSSIRQAA